MFEKAAQCEKGIPLVNETEPGQSYGWINFDAIGVTDNSGTVIVTSDPPGNELGRPYKFQITPGKLDKTVTFTAKDPSGNEQVCRFLIRIIGKFFLSYYLICVLTPYVLEPREEKRDNGSYIEQVSQIAYALNETTKHRLITRKNALLHL